MGIVALVVYFPQLKAAEELKRKKFEQQRDEAAKAPPVRPPENPAPMLPLDAGPLPLEPTAPPLPVPSR